MRWAPTPLEYLYHPGISVIFRLGWWGRQGGGRGTGDGRRKGGKLDLYDGGGRREI